MTIITRLFAFLLLYIINRIVNYIPIYYVRKLCYLCVGMKIKGKTKIDMAQYFLAPNKLRIGHNCHINQGCIIDARGKIIIGNNVTISHRVVLMTGSHNVKSTTFDYKGGSIEIGDNCFVGVNATILQNVTIGEGAIVCAGAVVTQSVPEYTIVAGVPAKIIGYRRKDLNYIVNPNTWFC